ncbi:TolB family protein [Niallia nealsonii]|uniref:Prolow-density lipoprotein receptor-related protein 1-like beta-propeller domain-containing protein n=1 Tax=Niallia nealsonii TaxID=115979 RepID=A0A2N0Z545_9BACI|nr:DUF5050 domain-containing protein [Niallia nealsonii]PKG24614.1 hypothetical protein CWS01_04960 [Niallia nealsonii]
MKNNKRMFSSIIIFGILLIGAVLYSLFENDDPYQYYTGLGDNFDLSSDDQKIVFSYYKDGKEAIFSADRNGKNVKQLTGFGSLKHHQPQLSSDGKHLLYLAENKDGNSSLYLANSDGSESKKLTSSKIHVFKALFSTENETIYYVGMGASDFQKAEGETKEGQDIYSINLSGKKEKQWTDADYFSIDTFLPSPNGKELYYGEDSGSVYKLVLGKSEEKESFLSQLDVADSYSKTLSPDGSQMAYTAVSKESEDSSLYEYELFLRDLNSEKTTKLTNLKTAVTVPRFFHTENKMAFLEHRNWSTDPAEFIFTTIDLDTKKLEGISFAMPKSTESNHWFMKQVDVAVNGTTISILYIVFVGLITMHQVYFRSKKGYLPSVISLIVTVAAFIASIIVAMTINPWYGIAIAMPAAGLLGCTVLLFIFTFVLNLIKKRKS